MCPNPGTGEQRGGAARVGAPSAWASSRAAAGQSREQLLGAGLRLAYVPQVSTIDLPPPVPPKPTCGWCRPPWARRAWRSGRRPRVSAGPVIAFHQQFLSRRVFLAAGGAAAAVSALPRRARAASTSEYRLVAGPGRAHLVGGSYPDTAVWAYNDQVPGPGIRARQGQRLRIAVENRLHEVTTVHWHGLRVPNQWTACRT